jgi:NitT/TauT family transport system permease protein
MPKPFRLFKIEQPTERPFALGDVFVLVSIFLLIYGGVRLARAAPLAIQGPEISLEPRILPLYTSLSVGRMLVAYLLSLIFTFIYGRVAANNKRAESVLMPLLDVLQSVPLLSFLPVVLLSFSAILPENLAAELASIVLIFTGQVWNLTYAWYQSLTTIPNELNEASTIYRLNPWLRFKTLELPFAAVSLIWNSLMSWSGGWFFLMAAEIFTVGQRDFRLPGLGAYLHEAANQGNLIALAWGIGTLIAVIVALDQLVWRPLLTWGDRFKLEMTSSDTESSAWFYDLIRSSRLVGWFQGRILQPLSEGLDMTTIRRSPSQFVAAKRQMRRPLRARFVMLLFTGLLSFGTYRGVLMMSSLPLFQWAGIGVGILATLLRVLTALGIALLWTIPVGVAIGSVQNRASFLQPIVQIAASVPATALFPVFLLFLLQLPAGLNIAAVTLMLMGTQWYLLFNIIAGTTAIPKDLRNTVAMLQLSRQERWRTLILPALFPFIITGAITASGGAWNASILAEYVQFGGKTYQTTGIGSIIAQASATGNYALLLAATMSMILTVVAINRLVWRRLYRLAEEQYRLQ